MGIQKGVAFSLKLAALAQLGEAHSVDLLVPQFRSAFTPEERRFPWAWQPMRDKDAIRRLIDGFDRAGILVDVGAAEARSAGLFVTHE
jgi:hypothetical protein